jgi:hypothetical protein
MLHNGVCINEIIIYGLKDATDKLINSFPHGNVSIQVNFQNQTETSITIISDTPEIILLEKISGDYHVTIRNTFYNTEADYAGFAIISHGKSSVDIETYYKGLYYHYPRKFWEEIDNLIHMMEFSGGEWEEIEKEIVFCQDEDYNTIKDMFKKLVRITG